MAEGNYDTPNSWRHCLNWLIELQLIRSDDSLTKETSTIVELQNRFLNGVLLCKVLRCVRNDLKEKYPSPINMTQKSKYVWKGNLELFKKMCKEFGISSSQIFKSDDLSDFNCFLQVLTTLSIISETDEALKLAKSFKFKEMKIESHDLNYGLFEFEDSDINNYLTYYDLNPMEKDFSQNIPGLSQISDELENIPQLPEPVSNPQRCEVIHYELLENEQKYLKTLTLGIKLEKRLGEYFGGCECKTIFYKFKELKDLHTNLLEHLRASYPYNFNYIKAGFESNATEFLTYLEYCSKYPKHSNNFKMFKECDGRTATEIRIIENEYGDIQMGFMLAAYDRITTYIKKLQNLRLMCTSETDFLCVSDALVIMVQLGNLIGTYVTDEEVRNIFKEEIFDDLHKIPENIRNFESSGRHIFDDCIQIAKQKQKSNVYEAQIFIFEEAILLFRRPQNQIYKQIPLFSKDCKYQFYKIYFLSEVFPKLAPNVHSHLLPEKQSRVSEFTLDGHVTMDSICFIPLSLHRESEVRAAILNAKNKNIYKERSRLNYHDFSLHTLSIDNIREDIVCDLCFKYFFGNYGQCYMCHTCKIKCHSYCLLFAPEIACGNSYLNQNRILRKPWWEGETSRTESEELLAKLSYEPNSFLVRWSSNTGFPVLSVCCSVSNTTSASSRGTNIIVKHIIIESSFDGFKFKGSVNGRVFRTLSELVKYFGEINISHFLPSIDANATLKKTLNTFFQETDFSHQG
ncbi:UNVERIFIED_CONTAM: hypothetical protein RMT77_011081 [Armadillidium vulgare]